MNPDDGSIALERDGSVAVVTLQREAKLNALTPAMAVEFDRILDELDRDAAVRCIVLTGTGRAFCAGSDISTLDQYSSPWEFGQRLDYGDTLRANRKPLIAAVNGYAYGGGLELCLSCDIRIAAESARFAAPEIKLGWIGGSGQAASLAHSIGAGNAALMLLTGDPIDSATALKWGLVARVIADGDLLDEARAVAHTIADRAPLAAQSAKVDLRAAFDMTTADAIALERRMQTICFATADAIEGRAAFAERRKPDFQGR
jgi:enoyl-CoA hydratase